MLTNKHFTPVVGLDIHLIVTPVGPLPIPHPFIGLVLDVMDYIPFIGSSVNVNNVPRGICDTSGNILTLIHIPMGGPFLLAPMVGHDSVNFFGSTRVKAESVSLSPSGYMLMTCNDIGIPLSLSPGKKLKPLPSLYLPTSFTLPLPLGRPVMVGGPYAPDLLGILKQLIMSYGFGAVLKGLGKGLKKLNQLLPSNKFTRGLKSTLCKMGFEPVDLITGRVIYAGTDFELPGIIPVKWQRNWYSDSAYEGPLGHGMHHGYDLTLELLSREQLIQLILPDGRAVAFPCLITPGDSFYKREEKLSLHCLDGKEYELKDYSSQLSYRFQKSGGVYKLLRLYNSAGFALQFIYDNRHQLIEIIDTANRVIRLSLDKEDRITGITAHHGKEERLLVSYRYNEAGDLVGIGDALGQYTTLVYRNHLMVSKTDRNGQSFYWEYDGNHTGARCVHTWGDGGLLEGWISYHKGYNKVTNSLKETSIYYYNELNLCTQVKDPLGNSVFHEYTLFMEPYRDVDEEGNVRGYTYDERGNLKTVRGSDGATTTYVYDEENRCLLTIHPQGNTRVNTYENNLLLSVISEDEQITGFDYNTDGLLNRIRNNKGEYTHLDYDADHNLIRLVLPGGATTNWKYDAWGRCVEKINPEKQTQFFAYDELDRVTRIHLLDENTLKLEYDAYDNVVLAKDKKHAVYFNYTPLGNLTMREQNGTKTFYNYNTEEQLVSVVNEFGETYRYVRNAKGDVIQEEGFDGLIRNYKRDRTGKILRVERPGGKFNEYEYDLNGNIIRILYSDGSYTLYSYDRNGQFIEANNETSTVKLKRWGDGQIQQEDQDGYVVESKFNELSQRIRVISSLGADVQLGYSIQGVVEDMRVNQSDVYWHAELKYNNINQETERITGNITNRFSYNFAGKVKEHYTRANERVSRHKQYEWSINDKLYTIHNLLNRQTLNFEYDKFDSIVKSSEGTLHENFFRDDVKNIYKAKDRKDRKYGPAGKLLVSGTSRYSYDEEGNLIKKETQSGDWIYEWTDSGLLKKVIRPDKKEVRFEYDALGRRTAKIFNDKITRWVWDGDHPLHEWTYNLEDRPKTVVTEHGLLATDKPEPVEKLITWIFDEGVLQPAAKIVNNHAYSIVTDYLGTPVESYSDTGEKVWECEMSVYGKTQKLQGSHSFIPFRYQGQYEDEETGLFYNRFRYFSPEEDAYISQDPIGLKGGIRFYAYVHDPNWWLDLFGLTGTYFFTDGTTSYIGKGPKDRMYASMKERVGGSGNVTTGVHHDFGNNATGLMVESELMSRYNAVSSSNFHNAINSPGKKMLDDLKINNPTAYNDIINKANAVDTDFKTTTGITCK